LPKLKQGKYMLILYDLDGTLIRSYLDEPRIPYETIELLPGRRERLAALLAQGHRVGLVTNQAGIAFGYNTEADAHEKIRETIEVLELPPDTPYRVCFAHPKSRNPRYNSPIQIARRKPSPAMIYEIMALYPGEDVWWQSGTSMSTRAVLLQGYVKVGGIAPMSDNARCTDAPVLRIASAIRNWPEALA
jgi:D-glycero-D-manno-heptose 1,7-bisphosphate phosphatase